MGCAQTARRTRLYAATKWHRECKKVATLLVYLAINVVLATVLEKQSKKTANILHAVLFFFTLGLLLLVTDDGVLQSSLVNMLGQKTYDAVTMVVLGTKLSAVLPLLVVEIALVLQTLLVAMFTVQHIVDVYLGGSKRKAYERLGDNGPNPPPLAI